MSRALRAPVLMSFAAAMALAQTAASPGNSIEGTVVSDRTGLPLSRAHVILRPVKEKMSSIAVDTDEKGSFALRDVEPGNYSLMASRDGYLTSSACQMGAVRLPRDFAIGAKESIAGLTFRLRPFGIMAGRVAYDDGEPAMNIRVEAYREYRNHLRHGYLLAASATSNDRGEYRMFGLPPGSYVIAAMFEDTLPLNEQDRRTQALRYTTTFYANATKLSEAAPIRLDYGQEIDTLDVFLVRVRKVNVKGYVISGATGEPVSATISLQRVDAHNSASIAVPVLATFDAAKRFEIRDVTAGAYLLWAESADGGKALEGRAPLTVGAFDVDDIEITVQGERPGSAVLVAEGGVELGEPVRLRFEPRNERGKVVEVAEDGATGTFRFSLMGDDIYDPFMLNLPNDFFLAAVKVNGVDMMPQGIPGSAASGRPFDVVIDSRGGRVSGRVTGPDDELWSRASVALIPDPPRGRVQSYRTGSADENGVFLIRGVAPGRYIVVAWLDDPPCDIYDPDGLSPCRAAGTSVEVEEAGEQNIELKMKVVAKQ